MGFENAELAFRIRLEPMRRSITLLGFCSERISV